MTQNINEELRKLVDVLHTYMCDVFCIFLSTLFQLKAVFCAFAEILNISR